MRGFAMSHGSIFYVLDQHVVCVGVVGVVVLVIGVRVVRCLLWIRVMHGVASRIIDRYWVLCRVFLLCCAVE